MTAGDPDKTVYSYYRSEKVRMVCRVNLVYDIQSNEYMVIHET